MQIASFALKNSKSNEWKKWCINCVILCKLWKIIEKKQNKTERRGALTHKHRTDIEHADMDIFGGGGHILISFLLILFYTALIISL